MSMQSFRFRKLCDRFGYKIKPLIFQVNGKLTRRPDIVAVERKNQWVLTVPKKIYRFPDFYYRDLLGIQHPDYFSCETNLYSKRYGKT